jgi:acyl-CoA reductase-like NAD-dependent aldehyde dehydrogenase
MSSVEVIINALAELEKDIDNLNSKIEEMKKRILIYSNEQIENLKQQTISVANEEAKRIVDIAKKEAEDESSLITRESDNRLSDIKKNIDSTLDRAVDEIVNMVLRETGSSQAQMNNNNISKADEVISKKARNASRKESQRKDDSKMSQSNIDR